MKEAADELGSRQAHTSGLGGIVWVPVSEGDVVAVDGFDAVVGDGHTVGVSPDVVDHVAGSSERLPAVDIPLLVIEGCQEGSPGGVGIGLDVTLVDSRFECVEEFAPEEGGEYVDVNEELRTGRDPVVVVGREAASGDDAMQMGMIGQGLRPGVEDGVPRYARLTAAGLLGMIGPMCAEVLGIGGQCQQGL